MKKICVLLALVLCCCLEGFCQATSLTIDNQTPGWLSSKIEYEDQKTLKNLKVTGYINSDDLKFIGVLMSKQSLNGCIDLEDANIVGGSIRSDNVMPENSFNISWNSDYPDGLHISHIKLPLSITTSTKCLSSEMKIDTISIGGASMPSISGTNFYKTKYVVDGISVNRRIKHIIFREGVTEIADGAFHNNHSHTYAVPEDECIFETVTFPSTLKRIGKEAFRFCYALKNIVLPYSVETIGANAFVNTAFMPDTLDLPLNLKTFCTNSFSIKEGQVIDLKENVEIFDNENWSIKNSTNLTFVIHRATPPVFRKGTTTNYSSDGKELSGCTIYVPKEGYSKYSDPTYDSVGGSAHHWSGWTNPYSYAKLLAISINVESLQLSPTELHLFVGNTSNIEAIVYPSDADNASLLWTSSNPNVVSVDNNGRVTAIGSGTAIITVSCVDYPLIVSTCQVTVTNESTVNSYTLTYMVDGQEYKTCEIDYGTAIIPEANPTKEGYTFSGWSDIPATMPDHDVTVTGTFTINTYKLTYVIDGEVYMSYDIEYNAAITTTAFPTKFGYTFSGWSEIPAYMPAHDVTVTGSFEPRFDVGNVASVTDFILKGEYTQEDLELYDLNGDGELNIGDLILIVRRVLKNSAQYAASRTDTECQAAELAEYTAAQFVMSVPRSVREQDIRLTGGIAQTHQMMCEQIEPGRFAVVVFSLTNSRLTAGDNGFIEVRADDAQPDDMTIENVVLAKRTGETARFGKLAVATAIADVEREETHGAVYDLKGRKKGTAMQKGVYIENGKKIVVR